MAEPAVTRQWAWYRFWLEPNQTMCRCSECGCKVPKGQQMWVSRYLTGKSRVLHIAKRVCSEECGQTFDYRAMSHQAWLRRHAKGA